MYNGENCQREKIPIHTRGELITSCVNFETHDLWSETDKTYHKVPYIGMDDVLAHYACKFKMYTFNFSDNLLLTLQDDR